ncbi:MAG: flagellar basal body L-ring protein FlgH [Alphaproteobacteria bacterium]
MRICVVLMAGLTLTGCNSLNRLSQVGEAPPLTQIRNPVSNPSYAPITMPMPNAKVEIRGENTLWKSGARSFFKDQRAKDVGDILTILVKFEDKADISNKTSRSRTSSEKVQVNNFMGFETKLTGVLPQGVDPSNLIGFSSSPSHEGNGVVARKEKLDLKVAATIIQVLPNGNFVVAGRQEIRVNFEVRELLITGIIRPQDIMSDNTISSEKIAEARVSYGGRGHITDVQQPPYGQQILDAISPF